MTATYPSLQGQRILITGGASGIGAAFVRAFAGQGCDVFFVDIDDTSAAGLVAELNTDRVEYAHCNLLDVESLKETVAKNIAEKGPFHCLINNAAADDRHEFESVSEAYWDRCQGINLKPHFFAAQAVAAGMKRLGGGSIINLSSNSYILKVGGMPGYLTAKAGIVGLTRALAKELGPDGIRVNALLPGWVMTKKQLEHRLTPEDEKILLEEQCLKEKIYPEDISDMALFLASRASRMISAQSIIVDGGRT